MNIAFLNQYARPGGAVGITRHADIGDELVARGHRVTVIASAFDYLTRQSVTDPANTGASVADFRYVRTGAYEANDRRRVMSMVHYAMSAAWATVWLRPRPDVVVGSSPHLMAGLAAWTASTLLGRPWILEVRDFWPSALVDLGAISRGGLTHRALEWLERRLYRSAAAIVSVPPNGDQRLTELGLPADNLVHIPNGAWPVSGVRTPIPRTLHAMFEAAADQFLIVYTGAMGMAHGLDTVIEAAADLELRYPVQSQSVTLLFIGDGIRRAAMEQAAVDRGLTNIRFHDAVPKEVVPAILDRADACLMLAGAHDYFRFGLSPNKMFNYFAARRPVLIASAGPTVVDENDAGIRFMPGDPKAMADAIVRMMDLPQAERDHMGERGGELVQTRYSIATIADEYEDLLRQVVSRAGDRNG